MIGSYLLALYLLEDEITKIISFFDDKEVCQ
jgi:hypothetical protein